MESVKDDHFNSLKKDIYNGHNSYLRMKMKGSSFFNDEWIRKIEDCLYELGQIINNPREVTTSEGNLTPIELAKKINYESIQHLASHSQYIKDIDENGNVVPAKILSQIPKEELHTYENRFIATFIRRLMLFVEKRYEFIRSTVNFDTKDVLYLKNESMVNGEEVKIETKITVKKEAEDNLAKSGKEYVERVKKMRKYITYYYSSAFMKELKNEKDVRKPILQTNIIRKNPYYHKCYETFLFIERFDSLGVEYTLDQHFQDFSEKERRALNYILLSHLLSLQSTETSKTYKKSHKVYKPKLLSSIDDEMFVYGDILKGPIEFVRTDEKYIEYLNSLVSKKIPEKPNEIEKEYFKDDIQFRKDVAAHHKEVDALLNRIRREIALWEKKVEELIAARNIEEAELAQIELQKLREQEEDILNKKRQEIIRAAMGDMNLEEEVLPKGEPEKVEEPVVEETPVIVEEPKEVKKPSKAKEKAKEVKEKISQEKEKIKAKVQQKVEKKAPKLAKKVEEVKEKAEAKKTAKKAAKPEQKEVKPTEPVKEEKKEEIAPTLVVQEAKPVEENKAEEVKQEATPVAEETKKEEVPVTEEVKPAPKKAPEKKAEPAKKPAAKVETKPEPKAEPIKEEPKQVIPEVKKEENEPSRPAQPKNILEIIPGRFIVKTEQGYYVKANKFSKIKGDAYIFDDFNEANQNKHRYGGKVIKL